MKTVRDNFYHSWAFNQLALVQTRQVVPGTTADTSVTVNWESAPFLANCLSGGRAELIQFYVPYRLVWDGFVDFIGAAVADEAPAMPQTNVNWDVMFEDGDHGYMHALDRRAYKLAYNEFYADARQNGFRDRVDVEADSETPVLNVRGLEQLNNKVSSVDDMEDDQMYAAPVSQDTAYIPLQDFRRQMANARSSQGRSLSGDKYVDAMQRVGVQLDWRVQMAPEFLGKASVKFLPKRTENTALDTGFNAAKYASAITLETRNKRFAEHGVVFTFMAIRPRTFFRDLRSPLSKFVYGFDDWWRGDNAVGYRTVSGHLIGLNAAVQDYNLAMKKFDWLLNGQTFYGPDHDTSVAEWVNGIDPSDNTEMFYPTAWNIAQQTDVTDRNGFYLSEAEMSLRHPIKAVY